MVTSARMRCRKTGGKHSSCGGYGIPRLAGKFFPTAFARVGDGACNWLPIVLMMLLMLLIVRQQRRRRRRLLFEQLGRGGYADRTVVALRSALEKKVASTLKEEAASIVAAATSAATEEVASIVGAATAAVGVAKEEMASAAAAAKEEASAAAAATATAAVNALDARLRALEAEMWSLRAELRCSRIDHVDTASSGSGAVTQSGRGLAGGGLPQATDLLMRTIKEEEEEVYPEGQQVKWSGQSLEEAFRKGEEISLHDFRLGRMIGTGTYASVRLATWRGRREDVALKGLEHGEAGIPSQVRREIDIQSTLRHPNILRMFGFFQDKKRRFVYLVLELAAGGDLYQRLRQRGRFGEEEAAEYFLSLAKALAFCHMHGVIHRDVKLENVFLGGDGTVKLADFGWSIHSPGMRRSTFCGTPVYLSPEMVEKRDYDQSTDIWALGVILFELLVGVPPFNDEEKARAFARISRVDLRWPVNIAISDEAKDLVARLLQREPSQRLPLNQVTFHPWIRKHCSSLQAPYGTQT